MHKADRYLQIGTKPDWNVGMGSLLVRRALIVRERRGSSGDSAWNGTQASEGLFDLLNFTCTPFVFYTRAMSNESSSSKRPRWTVNPEACLVCRKRKSRCRVISASGACERCREFSQRCSLQHSDVPGNIANSDELDISIPAEGSYRGPDLMTQVNEHRRLLVRLDHRTKDLLDIVRAQSGSQYTERRRPIHTQDGLGREFSGTREDGIGDDDDIEEGIQEMLTRRLGTSLLYVTGMNLHDRTSFVDPVGAGLISETGIESVFER